MIKFSIVGCSRAKPSIGDSFKYLGVHLNNKLDWSDDCADTSLARPSRTQQVMFLPSLLSTWHLGAAALIRSRRDGCCSDAHIRGRCLQRGCTEGTTGGQQIPSCLPKNVSSSTEPYSEQSVKILHLGKLTCIILQRLFTAAEIFTEKAKRHFCNFMFYLRLKGFLSNNPTAAAVKCVFFLALCIFLQKTKLWQLKKIAHLTFSLVLWVHFKETVTLKPGVARVFFRGAHTNKK